MRLIHGTRFRRLGAPLILLLPFFFSGCVRPAASASAAGGKADLSRDTDFNRGDLVRLDGEWEFRPGALLTPEDFAAEERGDEIASCLSDKRLRSA